MLELFQPKGSTHRALLVVHLYTSAAAAAAAQLKPSLRVTRDAEGPYVIGRERDLLRSHWLDFLHGSRQF
jgi:hypothetical protein